MGLSERPDVRLADLNRNLRVVLGNSTGCDEGKQHAKDEYGNHATSECGSDGFHLFFSGGLVDFITIDPEARSKTYVRTGKFISGVEQNRAPLCEDLARLGVDGTKSLRISAHTKYVDLLGSLTSRLTSD